jgi:hypothetical protein
MVHCWVPISLLVQKRLDISFQLTFNMMNVGTFMNMPSNYEGCRCDSTWRLPSIKICPFILERLDPTLIIALPKWKSSTINALHQILTLWNIRKFNILQFHYTHMSLLSHFIPHGEENTNMDVYMNFDHSLNFFKPGSTMNKWMSLLNNYRKWFAIYV